MRSLLGIVGCIKYFVFLCAMLSAAVHAQTHKFEAFGLEIELPEYYEYNINSVYGGATFISYDPRMSSGIYIGKYEACEICNSQKYERYFSHTTKQLTIQSYYLNHKLDMKGKVTVLFDDRYFMAIYNDNSEFWKKHLPQ